MNPLSCNQKTVFPWNLANETFDILKKRKVNFLRYKDLELQKSKLGSKFRYLDEYVKFRTNQTNPLAYPKALFLFASIRWRAKLKKLYKFSKNYSQKCSPPSVIMQHDVDNLPSKTYEMLKLELECNILSSVYVFAEHATDEDYILDTRKLKNYEKLGFEIGYHQNAYERSNYDKKKAYKFVKDDLDWLKSHFEISTFVPHGGLYSKFNENNENLPKRGPLSNLGWAFNGDCILKEYTWSDGGVINRGNIPIDPREFAKDILPGSRAMILMHPEYYGNELMDGWESLPIANEKWWRDMWGV